MAPVEDTVAWAAADAGGFEADARGMWTQKMGNEPKQWESNDPIVKLRRHLDKKGLWTEAWEKELTAEIEAEIVATHDAVKDLPAPAVETLFDDVFEEPTWALKEQKEWLMAQPRTKSVHAH